MAGYSGTPLVKKIGIKERHRVALVNEPRGFRSLLVNLPAGTKLVKSAEPQTDIAIVFTTSAADLIAKFSAAMAALTDKGMLWVAWPKKTSGVATDLNEDVVRDIGLGRGMVDVKVCAIDDTWSGLKFLHRRK
jgi:hypothetical protein